MFDYAIIGGGIVGLATAMTLGRRDRDARIILFEKESDFARHQSGRNSGVIHSGIYYKPGSFKARFAREGSRTMVEFCREHGIKHDVCGKVIVATKEQELPLLDNLIRRGLENGLSVTKLTAEQVQEIEPHVRCLAGIKVPSTGIADYKGVCAKYAELIREQGGILMTGTAVRRLHEVGGTHRIETTKGEFEARFLVNCAGLHSDRVALRAGIKPEAKIVPFRGEYYELVPEKRHLVNTLIYPVPNPAFPFLGVHFTKMIDGSVHAGPNAVLAFKREGYHKTDINFVDLFETLTFGGFWKLARKHMNDGLMEIYRSLSKKAFVRSLQELVPELTGADVIPTHAGVRAQALRSDGGMVDDFLIIKDRSAIHVCNAPSPAATASLEIGRAIANEIAPGPFAGDARRVKVLFSSSRGDTISRFKMDKNQSIYVAGHRGMVGSAVVRRLRRAGFNEILTRSRSELDLLDRTAVRAFFEKQRPAIVVDAAAKVGGIAANNEQPAEFLLQNVTIQNNVIEAAADFGARKLLFLGSSCIYPKFAPQPISESALLTGALEPTNEAYALAKIAGIKLCQAYAREYGKIFISGMPTNLYGPHDNFDLHSSHVLPALIRKVHEAMVRGENTVVVWGTGTPRREFLHVDDLADACLFLLDRYDSPEIVNIGCGEDVTIRELAETVCEVLGFQGDPVFDTSKPDGTPRKLLDMKKLFGLGWRPTIALRDGIRSAYEWFLEMEGTVRTGLAPGASAFPERKTA